MHDNEKEIVSQETQTQNSVAGEISQDTDYIEAIKDLKTKTVSKVDYDKLAAENRKLLDALVSGQEQDIQPAEQIDISELRNSLFNKELDNLEYVTKAMQLREALISKGEPDPFLPVGHQISPTKEDVAAAEKVAAVFQECIDYANGDSAIFTNELSRRTLNIKI